MKKLIFLLLGVSFAHAMDINNNNMDSNNNKAGDPFILAEPFINEYLLNALGWFFLQSDYKKFSAVKKSQGFPGFNCALLQNGPEKEAEEFLIQARSKLLSISDRDQQKKLIELDDQYEKLCNNLNIFQFIRLSISTILLSQMSEKAVRAFVVNHCYESNDINMSARMKLSFRGMIAKKYEHNGMLYF